MTDPVVHVVDDDSDVRDSIAFLLDSADIQAATYDGAEAFLEAADGARGCIVTDIRMPRIDGLQLVTLLKERGCVLPIIVITGHGDVPLAVEAMKAGVSDFIEKPFDDDVLLNAIKRALAAQSDGDAKAAERAEIVRRIASLSGRERQVLEGLVGGKSNKLIARELDISPRTIEIYRANLMTKMRAETLSDLIRMSLTAAG